jgi:hypothetical protein
LIRLLPDGFTALLAPAAALPAPVLMPLLVEVPVVTPGLVVGPVAAPPVVVLLPVELVPVCASANVLANVSAAAKPRLVNLMMSFPC